MFERRVDLGIKEWKVSKPGRLGRRALALYEFSEMSKRQFREIARVAGLVFQGYPGAQKSIRQVQASGSLFFDVFEKYDPDNLLLTQSRREVLERQLEVKRIRMILEEMRNQKITIVSPTQLTPFAFPLWAESLRTQVSSESWNDRVSKMAEKLESKP